MAPRKKAPIESVTISPMKRVTQEYHGQYPIADLQVHPENAKKGAQEEIDDSVEQNGFYGTVLVQRSTGYIVVGNHRYRTAIAKGAETIPVLLADLTDEQARRIMLADNRTSDLGTYDNAKLLDLIQKVQGEAADSETETSLVGTGYDATSVEALVARVAKEAETAEARAVRMGSSSNITFTVVFDDATQQSAWYGLLRALKRKYPQHQTMGARIQAMLAENPGLVG